MSADISDPKIKEAFDEVKNGTKTWMLLSYVPKSDTKLAVVEKGTGGINEFKDPLNDGKIFFGLIAFDINKTRKFAYISWCGEGVTGMKKGLFNNHANDVGRFLKGFHVQVNARNEDDLNEKTILGKLTKASGASYDSGAKIQGEAAKGAPTSFSEAKSLATKSNVASSNVDKSDYNKKSESADYWEKQKVQEDEEKKQKQVANQKSSDYSKSNERQQFWAQQQEEAASKPAPTRPQPAATGNAKSRFEKPAPEPAPAPTRQTAPPPKKVAPPPPEPEPVPEPEPEPVVEETYQEEPQQEPYQEPVQEEPQQSYQEEPQQETYQEEPQQTYQEEPQQETYQEEQQQQSGMGQCRAVYDYDAQNDGDLSFHEADIINILDKSDPNGWWQGEINGVTGYFPSNFVEEI